MMTNQPLAPWSVLVLSLLLSSSTSGQRPAQKPTPPTPAPAKTEPLSDDQLPAFATSLVISIATEARSFSDLSLRPRVMARSADVLWDVDNVTARALFKRAWDEAEKGDKEDVTINTKDKPPAMVTAMRRMSGRDLRFEVLNMMAKHDLALSEEYFTKLKNQQESEKEGSKKSSTLNDDWFVPEEVSKRLEVASSLLKNGQTAKAIEFAAPVLNEVNSHTINFLSELRHKNSEAADRVFATLLSRAEVDVLSTPNTVSGLSSYVFTPGSYMTFDPYGGSRWTQGDEPPTPPANFPPLLREKFFQVGATILMRPLPQSDPDARSIKSAVIKRLLPFFEQYAPDTAIALRAQLTETSSGPSRDGASRFSLAEEIRTTPPSVDEALDRMQNRLDRARTSRERDSIYAAAAGALLANGDERARDIAEKIENPERRTQILQHIDFQFIQTAITKKQAAKAIRLIQNGKLSNTQRAAAYIDVARLLRDTERQRSLELLEDAVREVNRIEGSKPDRAVLLVGIANQLIGVDRVRAWEIVGEVVKEANRVEDYTGENKLMFPLMTGPAGVTMISIGGENYSIATVFRALAKDDLYRAVDVAKSFKYDAPRAAVTLSIAATLLEKK